MSVVAAELTRALGGRWNGHSGQAFCPAHPNYRTPALSIAVGHTDSLLLHCFAGCGFVEILQAIKARGLQLPQEGAPFPAQHNAQRASAEQKRRAAQALAVWEEAQPVANTPGERYLRRRGIACELPETLRFHPECWHGPSAHRHPALVAMVGGSAKEAIHRTYLLPNGDAKATVSPAKMMLGATAGGAVHLSTGNHCGPLVVAEGIETALSLGSGLIPSHGSIWAALSASGMAKLVLPNREGSLIVAMDGDAAGRHAGLELAQRADALGWTVSLLEAPDGRDWNDVLIEGGA